MKNLFSLVLLALLILPGCGSSIVGEKMSSGHDSWLLYTNESEGFAIPYLDSWYVQEYEVPAGVPFAMIGFDRDPIAHTAPQKEDNGRVVVQVYTGAYMDKLGEKQKDKPGYTSEEKVFGDSTGVEISIDTTNQGKQFMTSVEKNGKTFIVSTDELIDEEDINTYKKMVEGLSLD